MANDAENLSDLPTTQLPPPRRHRWRIILYLTTLGVSALFIPGLGEVIIRSYGWQSLEEVTYKRLMNPPPHGPAKSHTPQQNLLLFGDTKAKDHAECWKPLWDSEPDNPAFFAQYVTAYFCDHKEISPDLLAAAGRIDPDNGWYDALAAAGYGQHAVNKPQVAFKDKGKKSSKAQVWEILDEAKLAEALAAIHRAADKPQFSSHTAGLLKLRIELLPPRSDTVSQLSNTAYLAGQIAASVQLIKMLDAMRAGAQECAKHQDAEGFRRIVQDWEKLAPKLNDDGLFLVDVLVAKSVIIGPADNFREAAELLGLDQETSRFKRIRERDLAEKDARRHSKDPNGSDIWARGSILASVCLPIMSSKVNSPPSLKEEDLRPARCAEGALFSGVACAFTWQCLGLCAGLAALQRCRKGREIREQSARMLNLLETADVMWVLAGGILLPMLWYLLFTYLTPWSWREWSFVASEYKQATGQVGSMLLLLLALPPVIASWRLGKRGAAFGLVTPLPWLGWIAAGAAALAVPVFGAVVIGGSFNESILNTGITLASIAGLWLLVGLCRNVFCSQRHALRRTTLARIVLPAWVFGMLVMAVMIPIHHAEERHWIRQDHLFEITADKPSITRYEWDATQVFRQELRQLMKEENKGN